MSRPVVLGFDLSTQSLSLLILSGGVELGSKWETEKEYSINYDTELPHYNTKGTLPAKLLILREKVEC
jgi:hypothetical protein